MLELEQKEEQVFLQLTHISNNPIIQSVIYLVCIGLSVLSAKFGLY